jgi:hypothetical protein
MKPFFVSKLYCLFLTGPGIRYVPENVWHSKFFWMAIAVMVVVIILYHNKSSIMANPSISNLFNSLFANDPNAARISYSSDGRSGHVHYKSREANFAMYYEFGGGDVVTSIVIPSEKDWLAATGLPLEQREPVLHFIGGQVVKDQTTGGSGSFKIEGNWLNIYGK